MMKRVCILSIFTLAAGLQADVKTEEKSQMQFGGFMGKMMGFFGGKAMKEGMVNTVAVKGNRKMSLNEYTGEIIDLDEERIYTLDVRKKNYELLTFAEMRRRLQEAREKAASAAKQGGTAEKPSGQPEKQMEIDFSLKESGQKKVINGFDCREVVMTITAREKGKTLEEGGGAVLTSNTWLAPKISAMKEVADFDRRYAEKLQGPFSFAGSAEQMAMAFAMYPAMKDLLGKFQAENVNMDGTAVLTVMTMQAVQRPEEAAAAEKQQKQESEPSDVTSVRGLGGLLGRKLARRKAEKSESGGGASNASNRANVFTMNHELLKVSSNVAASDVAMPAGFKEKK